MTEPLLFPLLVGESSFATLRDAGAYYVDKTQFIRKIFDDGNSVSLITRPRRFGKTLLQRTLQSFFELNYANPGDRTRAASLFKNLNITQDIAFCEKHMGQWPVLFVTFKEMNAADYSKAVSALSRIIGRTAQTYGFLLQSKDMSGFRKTALEQLIHLQFLPLAAQENFLSNSLQILTQILAETYSRRVIVLIDEYDVPLNRARVNGYYDKMQPLLKDMLGGALKDNPVLQKGVVTGCLRIAKESVFTDLNNFGCHSISDSNLAEVVGFTPEETAKILSDFRLTALADSVRRHYDGYRFGNRDIYCPWDLLSFCRDFRGKNTKDIFFKNYWVHTSSNSLITEFLHFADETHLLLLKELLKGNTVKASVSEDLSFAEINASHAPQHLLSLLYCTGYLTSDTPLNGGDVALLRIPNEEVRTCFEREIDIFFSKKNDNYINIGRQLAHELVHGKGAAANDVLADILMRNASIRDTGSEAFYHGIVLGLLSSALQSPIQSNQEGGDGYYDIRFLDKKEDTAVIIELKKTNSPSQLTSAAKSAVAQIHKRRYYADYLTGNVGRIQLYGIACCGKYCCTVMETMLGSHTS